MRKQLLILIALISVFALLAGCGSKAPAETTAAIFEEAPPLGVQAFTLSSSTWTSPNGATIHLTATPFGYAEGYSAAFVVMLGEEEVANEPCTWDGSAYTASAELNAANGLSYCVRMTAADGNTATIPLFEAEEAYVNLASSLESYCHVMVESSAFSGETLTLTSGSAQVQAPRITNDGEVITVSEAVLSLNFQGEEVDRAEVSFSADAVPGAFLADLSGVEFTVPALENDQQLTLTMTVTLSNGQSLSAVGGTFICHDGQLLTAVG